MASKVSEQPLYDLFMQAPAAIAVMRGKDHVFEFANPLYLKMAGKEAEIIGQTVRQAFPEIEGQGLLELLDAVYQTGTPYNGTEVAIDLRKTGADGLSRGYFDFVFQPLKDADQTIIGIMVHAIDVTDAVQARQQSAEDEERYRTLFTTIDQGFCILEIIYNKQNQPIDYRFIEVNTVFESQTGLKRAAGKRARDLIPSLEQKWIDRYHQVVETGEPLRINDHSEAFGRWFEVYASRIGSRANNRVAVLFTDITQRQKTELELRQSERRYRAMIESLEEGVSLLDAGGRMISANQSAERLLGLSFEQMQGRTSLDRRWQAINEDGTPMPGEQHAPQQVLRTKQPYNNQLMGIHKPSGELTWLTVNAQPILEGDDLTGIVVSFFDITERKRIQDELQRQLLITETITNIASSCLFMIDANGKLTYMNPAASRVTGYVPEEAIGESLHQLIHHSHADGSAYPVAACPMTDAYINGKTCPLHEDVFFRKNGSSFPALISATSIPDRDGVRSTVIEFRSIEEIRAALKRNTELEESTLALKERQAQLVALNDAKDEFIAIASHQLRTPATAVKQYLGIVLEGYAEPLTDLQSTYIQTAYDSNERQMQVINDLLKTANLDSNRYVINKQTVSISAMILEVIDDMQPALDIKGQTIDYTPPSVTIDAKLDAVEMKIVFMNLLENASKYSHPESAITISVKRTLRWATVTVSDFGVGIQDVNLERIFEKFTRINNELSDTVTGSGLGLYWVKKIINAHGGTIKVTSIPGKGSSFTVKLPL